MPPRKKAVPAPLDEDGYWRLDDVLKRYPMSARTWYRGIEQGRYPRPVRISPGVSAWNKRKVRQAFEQVGEEGA